MALREADWEKFLSPDSDIPRDVFFLVRGQDGRCSKIGAHRVLLAGVSQVFSRMFFGPMKETKEEMEVKETSPEAFHAMINYIYARRSDVVLCHIRCPNTLFELFALADRYDILNLKTKIMNSLWKFEIKRENLIYTATVANSYRGLFVDISKELLMMCLKFYLELDKTAKDSFPDTSVDILHQLVEFGGLTLQLSVNEDVFGEH